MAAKIFQYNDLIGNLVRRDLKTRYRDSVLGLLWTILNPLFMAAIYIFFLTLLSRAIASQYENIIIGVFAWQFTVQSITAGMTSVTGSSSLVKKVFFPRIILPLSANLSALVNFFLTLLVQWVLLLVILHFRGAGLPATFLWVPLLALYHLLFNLSLSLLVAASNVFFRDTEHIIGLLLSAWFFTSPVMYPLEMVQDLAQSYPWILKIYMLNPMTGILTAYRMLQVPGYEFVWTKAAVAGLLAPIVLLWIGIVTFQRAQRNFADLL